MTPEEQANHISWDLFHLECDHEWRIRGEVNPVDRNRCGDCVREALVAAIEQARLEAEAKLSMKVFNEAIAHVRREERDFFLDVIVDISDALNCTKHPEGHVDRAKEIVSEVLDSARRDREQAP